MSDLKNDVEGLTGRMVVIDLESPYVLLGNLAASSGGFLELTDADVHDLRDSPTTRERYVMESVESGIKINRRRVLIPRAQIVSIAALEDVVS